MAAGRRPKYRLPAGSPEGYLWAGPGQTQGPVLVSRTPTLRFRYLEQDIFRVRLPSNGPPRGLDGWASFDPPAPVSPRFR